MPSRVVCISAFDGAGGQELGRAVADQLGYRIVDEAIVARAAQEAGVEHHVAADAERRKTFARRLLDELGSGGTVATASLGAFIPLEAVEGGGASDSDLRALIRAAIEETAEVGNAVILAHAASIALADRADTLRVLVTASDATRESRIVSERGVDESAAAKLVDESDAGRSAYLKRFYDVGEEAATHYDLVVNTDRLAPDRAADLVVRAATDWPD